MKTPFKIVDLFKRKESLSVFILFLFFFPLKTQSQNLIFFFIDIFITEGKIQKVYTFNYKGNLLGCLASSNYREITSHFNWFQKYGVYYFRILPSLIAFFFLFKRWKKKLAFSFLDWALVIISCFSILDAINTSITTIIYFETFSSLQLLNNLPNILIFSGIGIFIFCKIFTLKERLQTVIIALPSFYLSMYLWFQYIGPTIFSLVN